MTEKYRTADLDPDYRRDPKTDSWCFRCQKDLKPDQPRRWIAYELDTFDVIHPDDFEVARADISERRAAYHGDAVIVGPVGQECVRKIGREFTWPERPA